MNDIKTLVNMIKQINQIITKKQICQMFGVFLLICVGSVLQLVGISIILPFIQAIVSPEQLAEKSYMKFLLKIFNIDGYNKMLIMVGIGIVCIYFFKNMATAFSNILFSIFNL